VFGQSGAGMFAGEEEDEVGVGKGQAVN